MEHFFGPLLEGLGSHSVTIFGSRSHLKIDQKINAILDRFLDDLGPILGHVGSPSGSGMPPGRPQDAPRRSQDAPKMLPRRSRMPIRHPKRPQEGPTRLRARFWTIFHRIVTDFSSIFSLILLGFSIDFSSMF